MESWPKRYPASVLHKLTLRRAAEQRVHHRTGLAEEPLPLETHTAVEPPGHRTAAEPQVLRMAAPLQEEVHTAGEPPLELQRDWARDRRRTQHHREPELLHTERLPPMQLPTTRRNPTGRHRREPPVAAAAEPKEAADQRNPRDRLYPPLELALEPLGHR